MGEHSWGEFLDRGGEERRGTKIWKRWYCGHRFFCILLWGFIEDFRKCVVRKGWRMLPQGKECNRYNVREVLIEWLASKKSLGG